MARVRLNEQSEYPDYRPPMHIACQHSKRKRFHLSCPHNQVYALSFERLRQLIEMRIELKWYAIKNCGASQ